VAIRRAELMVALSHATDLAIGQPAEYALKSCVLGMRLAVALGLQGDALREVYAHALLRYIGCNDQVAVHVRSFTRGGCAGGRRGARLRIA